MVCDSRQALVGGADRRVCLRSRVSVGLTAIRTFGVGGLGRQLVARCRQDLLLLNSLYIMATSVLTSALGYLFWILAARLYDSRQVGLAAGLISAITLAAFLGSVGLGSTFVERLPRRVAPQAWSLTVTTGFIVGSAAAAAGALAMIVLLPLVGRDFHVLRQNWLLPVLFVAGAVCWAAGSLLDQLFLAERTANRMLIRNAVLAVTKLPLLLVPVLVVIPNVGGILLAWFVSATLGSGFALFFLVPRCKPGCRLFVRGVFTEFMALRRSLAGHQIIMLSCEIPTLLLPVIVISRLDARSNAFFYLTWMLGGVFFMVSPAVAGSLFAEGSHRPDDLRRKVRLAFVYIALLLIVPMVTLTVAGGTVLSLFGAEYSTHARPLLLLLLASAVPDAVTNIALTVLRVQRRFLFATVLTISMAVLAIGAAWVLLPLLGITGAGLAWLIAQSVGALCVLPLFFDSHPLGSGLVWRRTRAALWRSKQRSKPVIHPSTTAP
jgi:O-antigen/teichoic acid export membrane protein